jgi:hypothetical protein
VLSGTAVVVENQLPGLTFPTFIDTICEGVVVNIPIQFTGTPPWTFDYRIDGLNPVTITTSNNPYYLSVSGAGNYTISSLTDANCKAINFPGMVSLNVVPKQIPDFSFTKKNLQVNFVNASLNATSYYWSFGDNKSSTLANPLHKYKFPGTYKVILSAKNDACKNAVMTKMVVVNFTYDTLSDDIYISKDLQTNADGHVGMQINILPNPSNGLFNVEVSGITQASFTVEIFDITGQLIYRKSHGIPNLSEDDRYYSGQIDLSPYSSGIYLLKVITTDAMKTSRLILNRDK